MKKIKNRCRKIACLLSMSLLLFGCTDKKTDGIQASETSGHTVETELSGITRSWTEEEIEAQFSARMNRDRQLEVIGCEMISDYAFGRVGAVLAKEVDTGTVKVAFMDCDGYFQMIGIAAKPAAEPDFAYLGKGILSCKLLTDEGDPYTCEVHFSKEHETIKYTVKSDF